MPSSLTGDQPTLPPRPIDGHKGTFGRVLIIAGSRGMSGAAALAGLGAMRSGAGLVTLAVPDVIADVVAGIEPGFLLKPLPSSDEGRIAADAGSQLEELAGSVDAIAIGPGLGRSDELDELVTWAYTSIERPVVVDADALNALATLQDVPPNLGPRVLTPHPGEFARLLDSTTVEVQADRSVLAERFAAKYGIAVALKGAGTVVTDGERTAVNETGNDGMATGGSGDVLTGVVAALLARGMSAYEAARLAVHVHGRAGDLAAAALSRTGLIASDLPRFLARAWAEFE